MNCKRCGARLQQGMLICPECGARQRRQARSVRCAYCHRRAAVELTLCPHCGRTLKPAGPRWGLWLVGAVLLVLAVLWGADRLPIKQTWQRLASLQERVSSLVQIPELPSLDQATRSAAAAGPLSSATEDPVNVVLTATVPLRTVAPARAVTRTVAIALTPLQTATVTVTATATLTPTQPATATALPSPTATATEQPTATQPPPTATPVPPTATPDSVKYYTVRAGDTLIDIGNATGFDWHDIAALNGLTANSSLQVGQKLRLPGGGPAAGDAAPTAAPAQQTTYKVRAGDTLESIGNKFGLSWQDVARANNLNQNSILHVDQELVIPPH